MFNKAIALILMFFIGAQHASLLGAVAAKKATGAIDKSVCTSQGAKRAVQDIKTTTSDILKLEDANGRFLED
ncbi:hypothetical protein KAT92_00170, partial [Candidatus Babeliales bacterium]|nr:hypothetical protein [Candidatus Babeliales bacterium]